MLRPVRNSQLGLRLIALKVTIDTDAATSSVTSGTDDISSITYNAAGDVTLALKNPFSRVPLGIAAAGETDNKAHVIKGSGTTLNSIQIQHTSATGTKTDGDVYAIIAGFDSNFTDNLRSRQFDVKTTQTRARLMAFHIDGTGTASLVGGSFDATLTDNNTGDYSLTFAKPYNRAPVVVPICLTAALTAAVSASTITGCRILTTDSSGAPTDADIYCLVFGWDSTSISGGLHRPIMSTQRQARLLPMQVNVAGGTPTIGIGSELATIVDNGPGDYTLTYTDKFLRTANFAMPIATNNVGVGAYAVAKSNLVTALNVTVFNTSGVAVDNSGVDILVLGFDSPNET